MTNDLKHRLGGLALLVIGVGFGWWGIWRPLQALWAHEASVSYSLKIFVLVPVALVFGLFFLLTGDRFPYRDVERKTLTTAGWILFAIGAIAALGGFLAFNQVSTSLGYQ